MSVAELSDRVQELEAALGIEAGGAYSDRVLALLSHLDASGAGEQMMEPPGAVAVSEAAEVAPEKTQTIEGQLARLKSLFGEDMILGSEPLAATIEDAVAAIESTLKVKPEKG